ncbi:hypothetical protein [Brevibacterium limosum]|uniref:hypothetical protein n=1 Tax=Brevibacterium limosum TaxID=2697565 RepID=UPI00141D8D66|nr:hypothetical protein [Brevibacterium limosum]
MPKNLAHRAEPHARPTQPTVTGPPAGRPARPSPAYPTVAVPPDRRPTLPCGSYESPARRDL